MVVARTQTMRLALPSLAFATFAALLTTSASAQEDDPDRKRSSHFIGELAAGAHIQGAGSFSWGALLGVGGKPRGVPARFYLAAAFQRTHDAEIFQTQTARHNHDLQLTDVDFGLRVYFPITRGLRITTEAMLGATLADAELSDTWGYRTQQNAAMPHLLLGAGPQLRLIHELSVGVMARTLFTDTENVRSSGALSTWKGDLDRRSQVVGTLTFHW
jgi:hypothetical protein